MYLLLIPCNNTDIFIALIIRLSCQPSFVLFPNFKEAFDGALLTPIFGELQTTVGVQDSQNESLSSTELRSLCVVAIASVSLFGQPCVV